MYETVTEMWNGFGKSIYSVIAISWPGILAAVILIACLWIMPYINLWNEWRLTVTDNQFLFYLVLTQVVLILVSRWIVDIRMKASWLSALFHPLGILFYLLDAVYVFACRLIGTGVRWKDCVYDSHSGVE